jgi:hypothetical protein
VTTRKAQVAQGLQTLTFSVEGGYYQSLLTAVVLLEHLREYCMRNREYVHNSLHTATGASKIPAVTSRYIAVVALVLEHRRNCREHLALQQPSIRLQYSRHIVCRSAQAARPVITERL